MLGGCLTAASRTRIPLIRHIVKCNYRGGLSGPRITDPPSRFSPPYQIDRLDLCFFETALYLFPFVSAFKGTEDARLEI